MINKDFEDYDNDIVVSYNKEIIIKSYNEFVNLYNNKIKKLIIKDNNLFFYSNTDEILFLIEKISKKIFINLKSFGISNIDQDIIDRFKNERLDIKDFSLYLI